MAAPSKRPAGRVMKAISRQLALQATLAIVFSAAVCADSADTDGHSKHTLRAKIEYCKNCHGLSGEGYHGFVPIPRLAGQQAEYFDNQLRAFAERRRASRYMYSVARSLSPSMRTALAEHFKDLDTRPLAGGSRDRVALGKKIYEDGIPEANIPACMACHGPDAKGKDAIPRLAGQLPDYILDKLVNWSKERGQNRAEPDPSAIMLPTSHNLTRSQITAIAAYLSYQR